MAGTLNPADARWKLPEQIGGWALGAQRGKGAYGVVVEATWVHDDPPANDAPMRVAIKVAESREVQRERAEREARRGMALAHRNVLRTYDVIVEGGFIAIVLELADESLAETLARHPHGLPSDEARPLMLDVAAGLVELHGHRIVHNDLRPENILRVGDTWKLADFGISAETVGESTHADAAPSVAFLPPEAAEREDRGQTRRAYDIWAYGIVMHLAITGCDPRGDGSMTERLFTSITDVAQRGALAVDTALPRKLHTVLHACLSQVDRRCDAECLWQLLHSDKRALARYADAPAARRRRRWLGAAIAVSTVGVAAVLALPLTRGRSPDAASTSTAPSVASGTTDVSAIASSSTGLAPTSVSTAPSVNLTVVSRSPQLHIAPLAAPLDVGTDTQLVVTVQLTDGAPGTAADLAAVVWSSDDPTIAAVEPDGRVRAVAPGATLVRATLRGGSSEALIEVGSVSPTSVPRTAPSRPTATTPPVVTTPPPATLPPTVATLPQAPTTNTTIRS